MGGGAKGGRSEKTDLRCGAVLRIRPHRGKLNLSLRSVYIKKT